MYLRIPLRQMSLIQLDEATAYCIDKNKQRDLKSLSDSTSPESLFFTALDLINSEECLVIPNFIFYFNTTCRHLLFSIVTTFSRHRPQLKLVGFCVLTSTGTLSAGQ